MSDQKKTSEEQINKNLGKGKLVLGFIIVGLIIAYIASLYHRYSIATKDGQVAADRYVQLESEHEEIRQQYSDMSTRYSELSSEYEELKGLYEDLKVKFANVSGNYKLDPCPLCGSEVEIHTSADSFYIQCPNCKLKTGYAEDKSSLVDYWNNVTSAKKDQTETEISSEVLQEEVDTENESNQ